MSPPRSLSSSVTTQYVSIVKFSRVLYQIKLKCFHYHCDLWSFWKDKCKASTYLRKKTLINIIYIEILVTFPMAWFLIHHLIHRSHYSVYVAKRLHWAVRSLEDFIFFCKHHVQVTWIEAGGTRWTCLSSVSPLLKYNPSKMNKYTSTTNSLCQCKQSLFYTENNTWQTIRKIPDNTHCYQRESYL